MSRADQFRGSRDIATFVWVEDPDIQEHDTSGCSEEQHLTPLQASKEGYSIIYDTKFISRSPPDVDRHTRIVAVVGNHTFKNREAPDEDGWFLSDFFLFMALFRGLTPHQTWIMADTCTPQKLVDRWSKVFPPGYVHGGPRFTRKIVLSQKMIDDNKLSEITPVPEAEVKDAFLYFLEKECEIASQEKQRVLVLVFGHGDMETYGIQLGRKLIKDKNFYPMVLREELDKIVKKCKPDLTLITNACYSGGWATYPWSNFSTMTAAAGELDVSEAWRRSTSYNRACGSIWASAVAKTLISDDSPFLEHCTQVPRLARVDDDLLQNSHAAFVRQIHTTLFTEVDRCAFVHNIRFSAQDDDWKANRFNRSGFPLGDYKKQYDALEDLEPTQNEGFRSYRHPSSIDKEDMILELVTDMSGSSYISRAKQAFGGTRKSMVSKARIQAKHYLQSSPGREGLPSNIAAHSKLEKLLSNPQPTAQEVQDCLSIVEYRTKMISTAERLLAAVGIPKLMNSSKVVHGSAFDADRFLFYVSSDKSRDDKWSSIMRMVFEANLFEEPLEEQFRRWDKPERYIAASLFFIPRITLDTVRIRLAAMNELKQEIIDESIVRTMRSREVRTTARLYFQTRGARVRSLSPRKRPSLATGTESPSTPKLKMPESVSPQKMSRSNTHSGLLRHVRDSSSPPSPTPRLRKAISGMSLSSKYR